MVVTHDEVALQCACKGCGEKDGKLAHVDVKKKKICLANLTCLLDVRIHTMSFSEKCKHKCCGGFLEEIFLNYITGYNLKT